MISKIRASIAPFETETVWRGDLTGTGAAVGGLHLTVGHGGDWAPEHLLLLATESCFMSTFLSLAAAEGIEVLGYVSNGQLRLHPDGTAPTVVLMPCPVVASADEAARLAELARKAEQESVTAQLLGSRLQVTMDIQTIPSKASD